MGLGRSHCRWICDRLPLLAGGELTGADRRKVERHLIACPGCRLHRESLAGALGVLHTAAGHSPVGVEAGAPSLWPALARQIREARHEPRPSVLPLPLTLPEAGSWLDALASSLRPTARSRPAFALTAVLALAGLTAAGVDGWVRGRLSVARDAMTLAGRPLAPPASGGVPFPPLQVVPANPGPSVVRSEPSAPAPERPAGARNDYGYDLDHGTPMGPDTRDVKASY